MIKRLPAILFILVANIVLLAHAVIPHHHHEKEVCIVSSHCDSDGDSHNHDKAEHKHQHHGGNSVDHCVLQQILISPPNKIKHEIKSLDLDTNLFLTDYSQAIFNDNSNDLVCFSSYLKSKPPSITYTYLNYASTVLGLRAPPLV